MGYRCLGTFFANQLISGHKAQKFAYSLSSRSRICLTSQFTFIYISLFSNKVELLKSDSFLSSKEPLDKLEFSLPVTTVKLPILCFRPSLSNASSNALKYDLARISRTPR